MSQLKEGDRVQVIDDSNDDTAKGTVGEVRVTTPVNTILRLRDDIGWIVKTSSLKKLSRLFPKPLTDCNARRT